MQKTMKNKLIDYELKSTMVDYELKLTRQMCADNCVLRLTMVVTTTTAANV